MPLKKTQTVIEQSLFEAFVRGYVQNEVETGVLTLARTPKAAGKEPWLQHPRPPVSDPLINTLLTVNLHAVNFSFGVKAYQQLDKVAELIRSHEVILGGTLE